MAQSMDYGMIAGYIKNSDGTDLVGGGFQLLGVTPSSDFDPAGATLADLLNSANMLSVSNSFATIDVANPGQFYQPQLLTFWSTGATIASGTQLYALASTSPTFDLSAPWALVTGSDVGWFSPNPADPLGYSNIELSLGGNNIIAAGNDGPGVGAYFGSTLGTATSIGDVNLTLVGAPAPPPPFVGPGSYSFASGEKAKLGIEQVTGARYQWLKGGLPVRLAQSNELDLTPGSSTFGAAQAGIYQVQERQGTNTVTYGPWVITHEDPTILVYDLTLLGTQSTPSDNVQTSGASETSVTLQGFLLLDRSAEEDGLKSVVIITQTQLIGKKIVGRLYWVEERPDVSVLSNGPVPGTAKFRPSRTLVAGLRGTQAVELEGEPEAPLWLAEDRDVLWLSGSDVLVKLDRSKTPSLIIAPATMTGFAGTAKTTGHVEIDNFSVAAKINAAETLKARTEELPLEEIRDGIIARLEALVPPFTPGE